MSLSPKHWGLAAVAGHHYGAPAPLWRCSRPAPPVPCRMEEELAAPSTSADKADGWVGLRMLLAPQEGGGGCVAVLVLLPRGHLLTSRPEVQVGTCPLQHPAWGVLSWNPGLHPSVSSGASSEAITCTYSSLFAAGKALCSTVTLLCSPLVLSLLCHASVWQPLLPAFVRINPFVLKHQNQKVVQTLK